MPNPNDEWEDLGTVAATGDEWEDLGEVPLDGGMSLGQPAELRSVSDIAGPAPVAPASAAPVIPSKGLWGTAKDVVGSGLDYLADAGTDFSTGRLRGLVGAPVEPGKGFWTAANLGHLTTRYNLGAGGVEGLLGARGEQVVNPFAGGTAGEKVFETPEALEAGRKLHKANVTMASLGRKVTPAQAEKLADTEGVLQQVGAGVLPAALPFQAGVSVSAKVAPHLGYLGRVFPKFTSFLVGAAETGLTMPVYGALGAETNEDRSAVIKNLLTNPDPAALAFMLLGGAGAAYARGRAIKQDAQKKLLQAEQKAAQEDLQLVAAIISDAEMQKMADELELRVAVENSEAAGPMLLGGTPFSPELIPSELQFKAEALGEVQSSAKARHVSLEDVADYPLHMQGALPVSSMGALGEPLGGQARPKAELGVLKAEAPLMGSEPVKAPLFGRHLPPKEAQAAARAQGAKGPPLRRLQEGPQKLLGAKHVFEVPPEFPAQVAITESPNSKFGTRAVIQWSRYGEEPRIETFELNGYDDARAFRKSLDKSGVKAEVSFSEKGGEALRQMRDPLLNDLLMFSAGELKDGKRNSVVKNRNAALVLNRDGAPTIESLSSYKVKAKAADNIDVVIVGTDKGPRFARVISEDEGRFLVVPVDEAMVGPTINRVMEVPIESHQSVLFKPPEWDMERWYRDSALPVGADKLLPFGEAVAPSIHIRKFKGPVTNPTKTRVDPTAPKIQRQAAEVPAPIAAAAADSALGRSYAFEAGGHQGPIAGAGGTKRANIFLKGGGGETPPAAGGSGGGGKRPPGAPLSPEPVPYPERKPVLEDLPESVIDDAMSIERLAKVSWNVLKSARKAVIGEHLSAPKELRQQVAMAKSAKSFDRIRGDLLHAQSKAAGFDLISHPDMDRDLVQVGKGNMEFDAWAAKHLKDKPQAAAALKEVLRTAMARRDFLHQELVKMGVIHPRDEMFKEGDMKKYFARVSAAFVMAPGKWLKIVEKDKKVWGAAKKWLMDNNPGLGAVDVDDMMRKMVNSKDSEGFLFNEPKLASAASHIKARKKMPPELRALYGQDMSGSYGFAETLAAQEVLYHTALMMKEFASKPTWALRSLPEGVTDVAPGSPYEGWTRLDDINGGSRSQHGALYGMHVHPDLKDALVNLPRMHEWGIDNGLRRFAREISSWTKMNETVLGGSQFYMNNLLGGIQHVMLSGIPPWEMPSVMMKWNTMAKALSEYKANPYAETPGAAFIRDALRVGGDVSGFGSVEIASGAADELATAILSTIAKDKSTKGFDKVTAALGVVRAKGKNTRAALSQGADWIDRMWRLSTFSQLVDNNLAAAEKKGLDVADPMVRERALRTAAERIARAFPMPDRLGALPDQARRYTGMFTPYLTYRSEVLRNYLMLPGTIAQDPKVAINLAAWGAALYGAYKLWEWSDPTPKALLDKERSRMPSAVEKYRPAMISAHETGIDGRPVFYDLTPVFEPLRYLQGPPDHPFLNAGMGLLGGLTEGGAFGHYVQQGAGALTPDMERVKARRREWNTGGWALLDTAWNEWSVLPKAPLRAYSEYESTLPQPMRPRSIHQQQDPTIAVQRALGMNIVRQPHATADMMDARREKQDFRRDAKEIMSRKEGGAVPGRGLVQGTLGSTSKREDLQRRREQYKERKK